jgi:hypothetical protein
MALKLLAPFKGSSGLDVRSAITVLDATALAKSNEMHVIHTAAESPCISLDWKALRCLMKRLREQKI